MDSAESFRELGYAVLPGWASPEEVGACRARADALLDAFVPSTVPSVFSTERQAETTDEYFLNSADKVSYFLEAGALDSAGSLTVDKRRAVNKVGHNLHSLDPVLAPFCRSPKMRRLLTSVAGMSSPAPCQSMLIFKHPRVGGVVVPHQDAAFLRTTPDSVVGFWVALEEATEANGCLWVRIFMPEERLLAHAVVANTLPYRSPSSQVLPRSHAGGVAARFVLTPERTTKWEGPPPSWDFPGANWVPLPASPGDVVLLHGAAVHASAHNASPSSRYAFSVHFVEADSEWAADNWLQTGAPHTSI